MIKPLTRTVLLLALGTGLNGCNNETQTPIPSTPKATILPSPDGDEKPKNVFIDSIGRLVPGAEKVDGFPIPKMATEETEPGAPSRTFRVRALQRALLEFYMHRDFHVVKLHKGHRIQHSSMTRERNGKDDEGFGTLFITQRKQRDQYLRFIPAKPPRIYVPEVNREVLEEEQDKWTEKEKKAVKGVLDGAGPEPAKNKRRIVVPFNPGVPRSLGTRTTRKQVKDWLKKNPGAVFYD